MRHQRKRPLHTCIAKSLEEYRIWREESGEDGNPGADGKVGRGKLGLRKDSGLVAGAQSKFIRG